MRRNIQNLTTYIIYLGALIFLLTCVMLATAYIPQDAIQKHMEESAGILAERPTTWQILPGINSSKVHPYADMLTLNIAYHLGDDIAPHNFDRAFDQFRFTNAEKLKAVMWAKYYGTPKDTDESIKLFQQSVDNRLHANKEYLRYWHGSAGIIRFMHIFANIRQIYVLHSFILAMLLAFLLLLLIKGHYVLEAISLIISLVMVSIWFVPICLEYYWCFFVMLIASIISVKIAQTGAWEKATPLFFFTGIFIAYLDFLTTETITLVIPLLLMVSIRWRNKQSVVNSDAEGDIQGLTMFVKMIASSCFSWLAGFSLMWLSKWILASLILQENVMPYVTAHIEERIGGDPNGKSQLAYAVGAIGRNLRCLLPFDYGRFGYFILGLMVGIVITLIAVRRIKLNKTANRQLLAGYFVIGCIPMVRYLVLHNHAWYHRSFTYRALAGSILALCFVLAELFREQNNQQIADNSMCTTGGTGE